MLAHMAFTVDFLIGYLYDEPNYSTLLTHFGERRPIDTAMVGDMLSTMVSLRRAGRRPGKAPRDLLLSVTFFHFDLDHRIKQRNGRERIVMRRPKFWIRPPPPPC